MLKQKILSVTTNISRYGGAQKVMLDLHNGLKCDYDCKILSLQPFAKLHLKYELAIDEFVKFRNPLQLRNTILIVHARNLIPFFVWLNRIFFLNTRIIYVSHNVYYSFRDFTFFPKEVVSISTKVTENLVGYFKIPTQNVSLIYNGMQDFGKNDVPRGYKQNNNIRILYSARVNNVKQQIQIVRSLQGRLSTNIELHFAGDGEDFEELKQICVDDQFRALGFVNDIHSLIQEYDYLMLFSVQEGLPLGLIEGIMHGKPILANDVGGNLEIGVPGYNGVLLHDNFNTLAEQLNEINNISVAAYEKMASNSRERYLQFFQYETMVNNYKNLIEKGG